MNKQDLVHEIDAVLTSKGISTRLCDTNIAWYARRVRDALTENSEHEPRVVASRAPCSCSASDGGAL